MRLAEVQRRLSDQLLARAGWAEDEYRPGRYLHAETGVQVVLLQAQLTVLVGSDPHDAEVGLSVNTVHYPNRAIEVALEVADAVVLKRLMNNRRGRHRKGGLGLPAGDMLLLLCAQHGPLLLNKAAADEQWKLVAGWEKKPAPSTINRAAAELRGAGLLIISQGEMRLTPIGQQAAADVAYRLGIVLPDPVNAT